MLRPLFSDPPQRSHVCCEKNFSLMFRPLFSGGGLSTAPRDYWSALKSSSVLIFSSALLALIAVSSLLLISVPFQLFRWHGVLTASLQHQQCHGIRLYPMSCQEKNDDNKHGFISLILGYLLFKSRMLPEKRAGFSCNMIKIACIGDDASRTKKGLLRIEGWERLYQQPV